MPSRELRVVVETSPQSGDENMARDEANLEQAADDGVSTLRWYRWSEPTISLGYFQTDDGDVFPGLPRTRRLSGGGAILHDDEWTYSVAVPREHPFAASPRTLYSLFHQWLIDALEDAGVRVEFRGQDEPGREGEFLCYFRGDRHDLVLPAEQGGTKVVGSAQRRRRGAVLQHGSVLMSAGTVSELRGLRDVWPRFDEADMKYVIERVSDTATRCDLEGG